MPGAVVGSASYAEPGVPGGGVRPTGIKVRVTCSGSQRVQRLDEASDVEGVVKSGRLGIGPLLMVVTRAEESHVAYEGRVDCVVMTKSPANCPLIHERAAHGAARSWWLNVRR